MHVPAADGVIETPHAVENALSAHAVASSRAVLGGADCSRARRAIWLGGLLTHGAFCQLSESQMQAWTCRISSDAARRSEAEHKALALGFSCQTAIPRSRSHSFLPPFAPSPAELAWATVVRPVRMSSRRAFIFESRMATHRMETRPVSRTRSLIHIQSRHGHCSRGGEKRYRDTFVRHYEEFTAATFTNIAQVRHYRNQNTWFTV